MTTAYFTTDDDDTCTDNSWDPGLNGSPIRILSLTLVALLFFVSHISPSLVSSAMPRQITSAYWFSSTQTQSCTTRSCSDIGRRRYKQLVWRALTGLSLVQRLATTKVGQAACLIMMAAGHYSSPGATALTPCPAGMYQAKAPAGEGSSLLPLRGSCDPKSGELTVAPCLEGTYQNHQIGQSLFKSCPIGSACASNGLTAPVKCKAGTHNDESLEIPVSGRYVPKPSATDESHCPPGSFSTSPESSGCTETPAGSMNSGSKSTAPVACQAGTYQPRTGMMSCLACPAGNMCGQGGMSAAMPYPAGTCQPKTLCIPAPIGCVVMPGSTSQTQCALGSCVDKTGQFACMPTPLGRNNPTARFVPRAMLDLEPANFVFGTFGAESCDYPQGSQMVHSLGGGTGSGLERLLLLKIWDAYPARITATFSVYPSPKVSDVVAEPYNAILSTHHDPLLENLEETPDINNEALISVSLNVLQQQQPTFPDLNFVISLVMSDVGSFPRFSGKLTGDLREMGFNLVPFPRFYFFLFAQIPLFSPDNGSHVRLNVKEINDQCWSARNFWRRLRLNTESTLADDCQSDYDIKSSIIHVSPGDMGEFSNENRDVINENV